MRTCLFSSFGAIGPHKCYEPECEDGCSLERAEVVEAQNYRPRSKIIRGVQDAIAFARGDASRARITTKEGG